MSEEYTKRRLPSGWSLFVEKTRLKSDINILNVILNFYSLFAFKLKSYFNKIKNYSSIALLFVLTITTLIVLIIMKICA